LTIAEELKRQKQIQEIDSESFSQTSFRTDSNRVRTDYPEPQESLGFGFGTSAEVTVAAKIEAKSKLEQLNSEGLLNPDLFGDQDERDKRFIGTLFEIRQNHLKKRAN